MFDLHRPHRDAHPAPDRVAVALHGHDGHPEAAAAWAALVAPSALVLAPRGPLPTDDGHAWFVPDGDAGSDAPPAAAPLADTAASLRHLLGALPGAEGLPAERTVLVGFSQGAAMALATLLAGGDGAGPQPPLRAVLLFAAFLPDPDRFRPVLDPLPGAPALHLAHGSDDEVVDPALGRSAARLLERKGWDVTFVEHPGGHRVTASAIAGAAAWLAAR